MARADGSWRRQSYLEPVRIARDGGWTPVDTDLHRSQSSIEPNATSVPVRFSAGGDDALASIQAENGEWVDVTWPYGALPAPSIQDNAARYGAVFPGVDLQLGATTTGFSTVFIVHDAAAAARPELKSLSLDFDSGALTARPGTAGAIRATSADGTVQLRQGQATWWDSSTVDSTAAGPGNGTTAAPISDAQANADSTTVDVAGVIERTNPTFPVYIDPSWDGGSRFSWTYVDTAYPTTSYFNGANLGTNDTTAHVGYVDRDHVYDDYRDHTTRSFFTMHTYGIAGKQIIRAKFQTELKYSSSCTKVGVSLRTANQAISDATTWNNQPSMGTIQDTQSLAYRSGECQNGGNTSSLGVTFDALQVINYASQRSLSKVTLALQSDEGHWWGWRKFINNPYLDIEFNSVPTTPAGRSIKPCFAQCTGVVTTPSLEPKLTAQSSDADAGAWTKYEFEIYKGNSNPPTQSPVRTYTTPATPRNTLATWDLKTNRGVGVDLLTNSFYEYRVRAHDALSASGWSAGYAVFKIDTTAPPAPDAEVIAGASPSAPEEPTEAIGYIGDLVTLNFNLTANQEALKIGISLYGQVQPVYGANPTCGSQSDGIYIVCRAGDSMSGSFPGSFKVAATEEANVLHTIGFDTAGNASASSAGTVDFYVKAPNIDASPTTHAWKNDVARSDGRVIDERDANATGTLNYVALQPSASGSVASVAEPGWQRGFDGDGWPLPAVDVRASSHSNAGYLQTPAAAGTVVDVTKSFTFTAWVKVTASDAATSTSANAYAVVGQRGSAVSGFFIDAYQNQWRFCMPKSQNSTFDGQCARISNVQVNAWTFLSARWDALNKHMVMTMDTSSTPKPTFHPVTAGASGPLMIGARNQPADVYPFRGLIYRPVVVGQLISSAQITAIHDTDEL